MKNKRPNLTSKIALPLAAVIMLLAVLGNAAQAQSALDGFDPNVNNAIYEVVIQSDGKILIGGDFTTVQGVARNRIARLSPDGTLDPTFNPNASGSIFSIAVQADGKVLVGGFFSTIGGQTRNFMARLDAITGLADAFNPNANSFVESIAVQADGKILAGGFFTTIGGQSRNRIARLDAATGLADSFNPNASGGVRSIAVQPDGKILAAGNFTAISGQTRNRIARLNATTGLADSFNPNADNTVHSIAVQPDGRVVAGGEFITIGGQTRNRIARLNPDGTLDTAFNPNANNTVAAIAVQSDGRVLAVGEFTTIGGQSRNRIARLDALTGLADAFNPNANAPVYSVAVQSDGKILAGGGFNVIGGQLRNRIARLERDGTLDQTLNLSAISGTIVFTTAIQPDGKIIIGGAFTTILGQPRNCIARLNTDGTLDTAFNPNANLAVYSIAVQADGKILVGGNFTTIGGQTRNHLARLDATTGLADAFNPNADGEVYSIVVQSNGKILAGGNFTTVSGQVRKYIARLDAVTGLPDTFEQEPDGPIYSIAVQSDGKILAGGNFTNIGMDTRNFIARFDPTSGIDGFNPNATNVVRNIAVQPDGKILVGGDFSFIGGQTRNRIARLDAATGLADSFNPNVGGERVHSIALQSDGKVLVGGDFLSIGGQSRVRFARFDGMTGLADSFNPNVNGDVYSIAVQSDGKILVGGGFTSIGGQSRNSFARLTNDTAALSTLNVTPTTLTLTRNGSGALLSRVIFEQSTDNGASYTLLGTATNSATPLPTYTLTGLNFPTGQNILIRARGYYRTNGFQSTSESIEDKVQLIYFSPPNTAPTMVAGSVSRQPGAGAANSGIAMVNDLETPAGDLTVTATTVPNGISISSITNLSGMISANLAADCTTALGDNTVVLTVTDAGGLTATANLIVNVTANTVPTITPSPTQVCASSTGNMASGPAGAASYAWTITNGTITSAADLQTITYTAGASGNVGLMLTVTNAGGCSTSNSTNVVINALPTTANAGPDQKVATATPVTLAANTATSGTGAWSVVSGPSTSLAQFSSTSSPTATFTPAGGAGYYLLRWTISNAPCTASADDVLITVANAPTIAKAFNPTSIAAGGTSTVTLTLTNPNPIAPVAAFTDTLTNMTAVGGSIGGTCGLLAPVVLAPNATSLSFSGIALPAGGNCEVTFAVRSTVIGVHPNTTSGVTTDLTNGAGAVSNTANLTVTAPTTPTINKAFSPATIPLGGTSTVSLTLNHSGATSVIGALTDTLTGMVAVGGGIGGSCGTLSAITIPANATNLSFSGIVLPGGGSCSVTFAVRGTASGAQTNTTSGVTTDQNAVPGPASNTATLTVVPTTIAKVFNPATIVSGGTSTVTLTLNNGNPAAALASFTDTLTNMTAVGGPIGTTCATLAAINLTAGATNLSFSGLVVPGNGSCTVSFPVTSSIVGTHPNTTSGVTMNSSGFAGPVSNTANLTVTGALLPTLARKAVRYDFDGDGKSDFAVFRADLGEMQVQFSPDGEVHRIALVEPTENNKYVAVSEDYDGDGLTDAAVFNSRTARWVIRYSLSNELVKIQYGLPGDVPMPADYDRDGRADLATYRKDDGWHIQHSSNLTEDVIYLGQAGETPVIGDFNGDGRTDVAMFNGVRWMCRDTETGQISEVQFGQAGDVAFTADGDGDGKADLIVWRPAAGMAFVLRSSDRAVEPISLGDLETGEAPVFGDYDGDRKEELAIFRVAKGAWEVLFNFTPR